METYLEWKKNCRLNRINRNEIWKDVKDYEGIYQVSSLGRVKSFAKWRGTNERILKGGVDEYGYQNVILFKKKVRKTRTVHQLVAESFLNHSPNGYELVVNHIDLNPKNNCVANLEIVSQRQNANQKHLESSSKYVGVCWRKDINKWRSAIWINGKPKYLGCFDKESEANEYYEKALMSHNEGSEIVTKPNDFSSSYKGVSWNKRDNKWKVQIRINGKVKNLGCFISELEAHNTYQNALKNI